MKHEVCSQFPRDRSSLSLSHPPLVGSEPPLGKAVIQPATPAVCPGTQAPGGQKVISEL